MTTTVSTKGQIVLPAPRSVSRMASSQARKLTSSASTVAIIRLVRRQAPANGGLVDWLLSLSRKDFFVPIKSESTETL